MGKGQVRLFEEVLEEAKKEKLFELKTGYKNRSPILSSESTSLQKIIMIYASIVTDLEITSESILRKNKLKENLNKLLEMTSVSIGEQKRTIERYLLEVEVLRNSMNISEKIETVWLINIDNLRERAISSFRTIENYINKTGDNDERIQLREYSDFMRTSINLVLWTLRLHPRLENDSSYQNIEENDNVPKSIDKILHPKDRFHLDDPAANSHP
jgi:hypothetical protein